MQVLRLWEQQPTCRARHWIQLLPSSCAATPQQQSRNERDDVIIIDDDTSDTTREEDDILDYYKGEIGEEGGTPNCGSPFAQFAIGDIFSLAIPEDDIIIIEDDNVDENGCDANTPAITDSPSKSITRIVRLQTTFFRMKSPVIYFKNRKSRRPIRTLLKRQMTIEVKSQAGVGMVSNIDHQADAADNPDN